MKRRCTLKNNSERTLYFGLSDGRIVKPGEEFTVDPSSDMAQVRHLYERWIEDGLVTLVRGSVEKLKKYRSIDD
jgi:hypothetical protein